MNAAGRLFWESVGFILEVLTAPLYVFHPNAGGFSVFPLFPLIITPISSRFSHTFATRKQIIN